MTNERKITFYYEWLQLHKNEFRILSMLADQGGSYNGNLSPILDYFNLSHQNKNRVQLRDSIIQLKTNEYIIHSETGRTHSLELIPKNTEIQMYADWYEFLKNHRSTVESVSWIMVLKTYLWILHNNPESQKEKDKVNLKVGAFAFVFSFRLIFSLLVLSFIKRFYLL